MSYVGESCHCIIKEMVILHQQRIQSTMEQFFGKSMAELTQMDIDEERRFVEERIGRTLIFPLTSNSRRRSYGNPLIAKRRFRTIEEVDARILEILCQRN